MQAATCQGMPHAASLCDVQSLQAVVSAAVAGVLLCSQFFYAVISLQVN
jgi:hypothetical protein